MNEDLLLTEEIGAVRSLTINRPDQLNALNQELISQLDHQLKIAASDASIRVMVLSGAGGKAFAAGADIKELQSLTPLQAVELSRRTQAMMQRIRDIPIPVIAAVNGFALGGGLELALACDFIFASEKSVLGLVESELGLIPGYGGVGRLVDRIGESQAREALYTARKFTAEESLAIGLVNRVLPESELTDTAMSVAQEIADKSRGSIGALKSLFEATRGCSAATIATLEQSAFGLAFADPDAQEGILAFIEKRRPRFGPG